MQHLRLKAIDTLFFGDGKPFSIGEENIASGVFPPYPTTCHGALRAMYFGEHPAQFDNMRAAIGADQKLTITEDPTLNLELKWMSLEINEELFVPAPYNLVQDKARKHGENKWAGISELQLKKAGYSSHIPLTHHLVPEAQHEGKTMLSLGGQAFIKWEALVNYWETGTLPQYENLPADKKAWISKKDIALVEPKIGMGKDPKTGSAMDGRLYRIQMRRPYDKTRNRNIDFNLGYESMGALGGNRTALLGAESRTVHYSTGITPGGYSPKGPGKRFGLYLLTPGIFEAGWRPGPVGKHPDSFSLKGIQVKLLAAATDKYIPIGGYALKNGSFREMKRAVPAGAVYFFELNDSKDWEQMLKKLHGQAISDNDTHCQQGFGIAYVFNIDSSSKTQPN